MTSCNIDLAGGTLYAVLESIKPEGRALGYLALQSMQLMLQQKITSYLHRHNEGGQTLLPRH